MQQVIETGAKKARDKSSVAPPVVSPETAAAVSAGFTPNFKFRANKQDHEIPEFLRGAIKDAESEKFVKKLFERAHGFDGVEQRYRGMKETHQELLSTHNSVMSQVAEAQEAYRAGDIDTFFETIKVDPAKILQWAVKKVELSQLPPEQRALHEERLQAQRELRLSRKETESHSREQLEGQGKLLNEMLDLVLERPQISAVAQAYDGRKGSEGAFRNLVVRIAQTEAATTGKTLSPLEAANQALELLGELQPKATPAAAANPAPTTVNTAAQSQPQPKKVLPNLANAGAKPNAAPAKSKIKSLDDLKRRRDEIMGVTN